MRMLELRPFAGKVIALTVGDNVNPGDGIDSITVVVLVAVPEVPVTVTA